jgi:hypothetical protein
MDRRKFLKLGIGTTIGTAVASSVARQEAKTQNLVPIKKEGAHCCRECLNTEFYHVRTKNNWSVRKCTVCDQPDFAFARDLWDFGDIYNG